MEEEEEEDFQSLLSFYIFFFLFTNFCLKKSISDHIVITLWGILITYASTSSGKVNAVR